ncbi:7 transmembrane receptor [Necator americanus]|uniref:7 transmembrane receptor n=1 Tax=Necator americanus TaxID=51031 RepID=W2TVQ3_NECAM|nr:7 transmembrane receptor [Necator americanus]ETN85141.1 7 transmembrane receptor [Necator americanus]
MFSNFTIMINCEKEDDRCMCLAIECPRVYNYSVTLKEECWMEECFISKRALNHSTLLQVTVGYIIILIVGLLGNILAISVLRRHPLMKTHSSVYIINLAIADLITLCVGLPFELIMNWSQYPWPFPDIFCNLKALIAEATMCHPFLFVKIKSIRQNVNIAICLVWIIAALFASPFGFYHRADYILKDWPGTDNKVPVYSSKMCMVAVIFDRSSLPMYRVIFHFSALMFFAIPISIILVLHILIAIRVRSSRKDINRSDSADEGKLRLTIILTSIVCALFVCHLPFQFQRLLFFYLENEEAVSSLNQYLFFISGFLFYLAPIINPILYNVVSSRFRKASKDMLVGIFNPSNLPQNSTMYRYSSANNVASNRVDLHQCVGVTRSNQFV